MSTNESSSNSNKSSNELHGTSRIVLLCMAIIIVLLNSISVIIICSIKKERKKRSDQLLVNLLLCHALIGLISVSESTVEWVTKKNRQPSHIVAAGGIQSVCALIVLTIDRYVCIKHPFIHSRLPNWLNYLMITFTWLIGLSIITFQIQNDIHISIHIPFLLIHSIGILSLPTCNTLVFIETRKHILAISSSIVFNSVSSRNAGAENDVKTSENDVNTSENDVKTTENDVNSSENDVKTPENDLNVSENDVKTPENDVNTSENDANSSEIDVKIPENYVNSSEIDVKISENDVNSPENDVKTPENNVKNAENKIHKKLNCDTKQSTTQDLRRQFIMKKEIRAAYICIFMVATYVILWLPLIIMSFCVDTGSSQRVSFYVFHLTMINSIADPLTYMSLSRDVKSRISEIYLRYKMRSTQN